MQKQDARTPVQPSRSGQANARTKMPTDTRHVGARRPVTSTPAGEVDRLMGMWDSL